MCYILIGLNGFASHIARARPPWGSSVGLIQINEQLAVGKTVQVSEETFQRLGASILRIGSLVTLSDQNGKDFRARIITLNPGHCEAFVFEAFGASVESPVHIHLMQALPKKERLEWIIQKATELGVHSIVPFESEKSISLAERDTPQKKSHRWHYIAAKAAQQCRRARIPHVYPVLRFHQALDFMEGNDLKLLLWEREPSQHLKTALAAAGGKTESITLVVGPEGGFSQRELDMAQQRGYVPARLGRRILRTETAAITAIAILQYALGDLGRRAE